MDLPDTMTPLQAMAFICWRTTEAVAVFSVYDAPALWRSARAGFWPLGLGPPLVPPCVAEYDLKEAVDTGALPVNLHVHNR
jgi:hypothetical protein